jgi:leader peptidase (prepilin peptidase) / N-methyltransferase
VLALPLWFLLLTLSILGAIWGSFVAALCSRWPRGDSITTGRSRCDRCAHQIASYDLVPIISHLLLNGRCRYCRVKIGLTSLAIEVVAALGGMTALLLLPADQGLAAAIFFWILLPLIILDYRHLWLPNLLVLPLAVAGLVVGPVLTSDIIMMDRVIGLLAGFLSLEAIRLVYKKYRKQDGMGVGDPKLFGALGIWLGWQSLPMTLLVASGIGIAIVLVMHFTAKGHRMAFPFGSYLSVAACLVILLNHHLAMY